MRARGKQAREIVRAFSGHSLRAGYATTAASKDVASYRIRRHTRDKWGRWSSAYAPEAEAWTKSGLKGVRF